MGIGGLDLETRTEIEVEPGIRLYWVFIELKLGKSVGTTPGFYG